MNLEPDAGRPDVTQDYIDQLMPNTEPGARSRRSHVMMVKALEDIPTFEFDDAGRDDDVLVWSDLHFGHANIIKYCDRPYADADEMDRALVNAMYGAMDESKALVVVGDVAMKQGMRRETWDMFRAMPRRESHLVVGNHDLIKDGVCAVLGFDHVWSVMHTPGPPPLIWTHYPLDSVPDGHINVHGHTHNRLYPEHTRHINVSVEQLDYRPVALSRIKALAAAILEGRRPDGGTTLEMMDAL